MNTGETDWRGETGEIRSRYARREKVIPAWKHAYYRRAQKEREAVYTVLLSKHFGDLSSVRMLEAGAGCGTNLPFFHAQGIPWSNIYANELLDENIPFLTAYNGLNVIPGNARDVTGDPFDLILSSTVFTSILDDVCRRELATHLLSLLSDQGMFLWFDFVYKNPLNRDVRGIRKQEIRELFPGTSIEFWKIGLLPPIALCVGPLYRLFRKAPFLRSHLIAKIVHS